MKWTYQINGQPKSHPFSSFQNAIDAAYHDFRTQCEGLNELDSAHVKCTIRPTGEGEPGEMWLSYRKGGDCLECGRDFKDNSKWWPCCSSQCAAKHYD